MKTTETEIVSFSSEIPTREGGYWMTCMENEHEKEWVKVFERNGILMADLDLGIYDLRSIHSGLADVKWAHAISVIPESH